MFLNPLFQKEIKMKNLILLTLFIAAAAFNSANAQDIYSCVNDLVIQETPKRPGVRGAVSKPSKKWLPGQEIRVKFLDGNEFVRSKVKQNAEIWEEFANVDFVFVASGKADIRITFGTDKGSWSFIGRDSQRQSWVKKGNESVYVPDDSGASMNFGWFNDKTSDEEFRRTTLHEFGHALGLMHEHQNKNRNIQWNDEAVYAYFAKQGWSREKVRSQVLERYGNNTEVTNGVYDRLSIMHYSYPPGLVKGNVSFPTNTTLSAGDKAIIREIYPFDEDEEEEEEVVVAKPTVKKPVPPVVPPTAPIFSISDAYVDYEAYNESTEQDGMEFVSDFQVKNGLKQEFSMAVYFYTADGTPLEDTNKKFYSANGKVAAFKKFTPAYPTAVYNQFKIFMPYEELELECGEHNLKYSITIWQGQKRVVNTGFSYFEMNVPCEEEEEEDNN